MEEGSRKEREEEGWRREVGQIQGKKIRKKKRRREGDD